MTYKSAAQWCERFVPMNVNSFDKWMDKCFDELQTPRLFEEDVFIQLLGNAWNRRQIKIEKQIEPPEPEAPIETTFQAVDTVKIESAPAEQRLIITRRISPIALPEPAIPLEELPREQQLLRESQVRLPSTGFAPEIKTTIVDRPRERVSFARSISLFFTGVGRVFRRRRI